MGQWLHSFAVLSQTASTRVVPRHFHPLSCLPVLTYSDRFSSFLFFTCLMSFSPPSARQKNIRQAATQDDIPVSITFNLLFSVLFNPSSRAIGQRLPTQSRYRARRYALFSYAFTPSFVAHTLSIQSPSPTPLRSPSIQSLDLAESCTYVCEDGLIQSSSVFLFSFVFP